MKRLAWTLVAVAFCTVGAQDAMAESDLGLKGVGVKVGVVSPEDLDATLGFGAFVDLGTVAPRFALEPYLDYWSQSETVTGTESKAQDMTLGMHGNYLFPVGASKFQPYAGVGLGIHFLKAEVTSGTTTIEDSSTELGMDLGGGVSTSLSQQIGILGEMWYGFTSEVNQFSARVGLEYKLGN